MFHLMFHICLRGDFPSFSFVFMDFKIPVENSLSSDRLPHPRGRPCVSQPAADQDAGAEQRREPAERVAAGKRGDPV